MCQSEGIHQIVMSFSTCLLKKAHRRGVTGTRGTPPPWLRPYNINCYATNVQRRLACTAMPTGFVGSGRSNFKECKHDGRKTMNTIFIGISDFAFLRTETL